MGRPMGAPKPVPDLEIDLPHLVDLERRHLANPSRYSLLTGNDDSNLCRRPVGLCREADGAYLRTNVRRGALEP